MAKLYTVKVVVANKEGASDPEGETVYRDLVSKSGFGRVKSIRTGKFLRVSVEAPDAPSAKRLVQKMCDELRIYNPAAHSVTVEV
ncbi:MAG TPA: phosphoribosylformylglycinamidine synthase subunit PurS [Nitrososphaerales archaeon]|nr:phosphoribosylformylglycinamidine synthase subunit PurS [Nitrososphaerales archaeon]